MSLEGLTIKSFHPYATVHQMLYGELKGEDFIVTTIEDPSVNSPINPDRAWSRPYSYKLVWSNRTMMFNYNRLGEIISVELDGALLEDDINTPILEILAR